MCFTEFVLNSERESKCLSIAVDAGASLEDALLKYSMCFSAEQ